MLKKVCTLLWLFVANSVFSSVEIPQNIQDQIIAEVLAESGFYDAVEVESRFRLWELEQPQLNASGTLADSGDCQEGCVQNGGDNNMPQPRKVKFKGKLNEGKLTQHFIIKWKRPQALTTGNAFKLSHYLVHVSKDGSDYKQYQVDAKFKNNGKPKKWQKIKLRNVVEGEYKAQVQAIYSQNQNSTLKNSINKSTGLGAQSGWTAEKGGSSKPSTLTVGDLNQTSALYQCLQNQNNTNNESVNDAFLLADITDIKCRESGLVNSDVLALSDFSGLVKLDVSKNSISNISPLSHLEQLSWLNLNKNIGVDLTPLGVEGNFLSLESLYLNGLRIDKIPAIPDTVTFLGFVQNTLSDNAGGYFPQHALDVLDVSNNYFSNNGSNTLLVNDQFLQNLALNNVQVKTLKLRHTVITDLDNLSGIQGLENLELWNANLNGKQNFQNLSGFCSLKIQSDQLKKILTKRPVQFLDLSDNPLLKFTHFYNPVPGHEYQPLVTNFEGSTGMQCTGFYKAVDSAEPHLSSFNNVQPFNLINGNPAVIPNCPSLRIQAELNNPEYCKPNAPLSVDTYKDINSPRFFVEWGKNSDHDYERWGVIHYKLAFYDDTQLLKVKTVDVNSSYLVEDIPNINKVEISACTVNQCGYITTSTIPFEHGLTKVENLKQVWSNGLVKFEFEYDSNVFNQGKGKPDYFEIAPVFPQLNGTQSIPNIDSPQNLNVWRTSDFNPDDYVGDQFYVRACRNDIGCGVENNILIERPQPSSEIGAAVNFDITVTNDTNITLSWSPGSDWDQVDYIEITETQPELSLGHRVDVDSILEPNIIEKTYVFYTDEINQSMSLERVTNGYYSYQLRACSRDRENGDNCSSTSTSDVEIERFGPSYTPWKVISGVNTHYNTPQVVFDSRIRQGDWKWPSDVPHENATNSPLYGLLEKVYYLKFRQETTDNNRGKHPDYYYFENLDGSSNQCYERIIEQPTEPGASPVETYHPLSSFVIESTGGEASRDIRTSSACYFPKRRGEWGISACYNGIGCSDAMIINMASGDIEYLDNANSEEFTVEFIESGEPEINQQLSTEIGVIPSGHYWNADQSGTGWQFYWATHLDEYEDCVSENNGVSENCQNLDHGVTFDLTAYWFGYKKKYTNSQSIHDSGYYKWTPVWYKSKLKKVSPNHYKGDLVDYSYSNGSQPNHFGSLEINLAEQPTGNYDITVQLDVNQNAMETRFGNSMQSQICDTDTTGNLDASCMFKLQNYHFKMVDNGHSQSISKGRFGLGNDKDHYSGVWEYEGANGSFPEPEVALISTIHRGLEVSWVATFDSSGDAIWAVSESCNDKTCYIPNVCLPNDDDCNEDDPCDNETCNGPPTENYFESQVTDDSNLNLYTIPEGFNPLNNTPIDFWNNSPVQTIGRLGRCFSGSDYNQGGLHLNVSTALDYGSNFVNRSINKNLGTAGAVIGQSCESLLSQNKVEAIEKVAGLNYISFKVNDTPRTTINDTCDPNIDGYCAIKFSWYTDLNFESITPYYSVNNGAYSSLDNLCDIAIPPGTAVKEFVCPIDNPGTYRFQLRKNKHAGTGTEIIAESGMLVVMECDSGLCNDGGNNPQFADTPDIATHVLTTNDESSLVGFTNGAASVDMSGSASYSVPIFSPASTGGLKPQLSLSYNSSANNGMAGLGWSIGGLSSISRCLKNVEQDAVGIEDHKPITLDNTDVFCLDGQKLFQLPNNKTNGENGAEYRTEFESFSKIVVNADDTSGPDTFTVYLKNGEIRTYGSSVANFDAQVKSSDGSAVVSWLLNKISDRNGNEIWFEWDNSINGETYLDKVKYTVRNSSTPQNVIDFTYEDRPDKKIRYSKNSISKLYKRLSAVSTKKRMTKTSALQTVRKLVVEYEPSPLSDISRVSSVKSCANDTDCLKPLSFEYSSNGSEKGFGGKQSSNNILGFAKMTGSYKPIDLNGDGRLEILYPRYDISGSTPQYRFVGAGNSDYIDLKPNENSCATTDSGYFNRSCNFDIQPARPQYNKITSNDYYVYDFNGDGFEDLLSPIKVFGSDEESEWKISYSNGQKLCQSVESGSGCIDQGDTGITWFESAQATSFIDFTADGRPDLLAMGTNDDFSDYHSYVPFYDSAGVIYESYIDNSKIKIDSTSGNQISVTIDTSGVPLSISDIYCHDDYEITPGHDYMPCEEIEDNRNPQDPIDLPSLAEISSISALANDFNGDGLSDLLVSYRYLFHDFACLGGNRVVEGVEVDDSVQASDFPLSGSHCWVKWYAVHTYEPTGEDTGVFKFSEMIGMSKGAGMDVLISDDNGVTASDYVNPFLDFGWKDEVSVQDINGDYLADVLTEKGVLINNGQGFEDLALFNRYDSSYEDEFGPYYKYSDVIEAFRSLTRFIDYDNDGDLDLLYPGPETSENEVYYRLKTLDYNEAEGYHYSDDFEVTSIVATHKREGENVAFVHNIFWDFNGDNHADHLFVKVSPGDGKFTEFGNGSWNARDKLVSVSQTAENDIENKVEFVYESASLPTVYAKTNNGFNANWGNSSAVFDIKTSEYLVRQFKQSSPTESNSNHSSSVFYYYKGMKLQGGGRGSLGFEKMTTVDPQSNISTTTNYLQNFPYIGSPLSTETYHHDSIGLSSGALSCLVDTPDCAFSSCSGNSCQDPLIKDLVFDPITLAVNGYEEVETASEAGSVFVFLDKSIEDKFELDASDPYITTITTMDYDDKDNPNEFYGNVKTTLNEVCSSYDDDGCTVLTSTETSNIYDDENPGDWILGRLSSSTVTTKRFDEEVGSGYLTASNATEFKYNDITGQLEEETLNPLLSGALYLKTLHIHDSYGNETDSIQCSKSIVESNKCTIIYKPSVTYDDPMDIYRRSQVSYDDKWHLYPDWNKEYFGHVDDDKASLVKVSEVTSRNIHGGPLVSKDLLNGITSNFQYGLWGELQSSTTDIGTYSESINAWCDDSNDSTCPAVAVMMTTKVAAGSPTSRVYKDEQGRTVRSQTQSLGDSSNAGAWSTVDTTYDESGRSESVTSPYFITDTNGAIIGSRYFSEYEYDDLNRVIQTTNPSHNSETSVTSITYDGLKQTTLNAKGQQKVTHHDQSGKVVLIEQFLTDLENSYSEISYIYGPKGNLLSMDSNGSKTTMTYDQLGRKESMNDPDKGGWTYTYDLLGNLIEQTDGLGQVVSNVYDIRGRLVKKSGEFLIGEQLFENVWNYDIDESWGKLIHEVSITHEYTVEEPWREQVDKSYIFDAFGRISTVNTLIYDGENGNIPSAYNELTTYDEYGRVFQQIDATGFGTMYGYNDFGYQTHIYEAASCDDAVGTETCVDYDGSKYRLYYQALAMNARGNVIKEQYHDGSLTTVRNYHSEDGFLMNTCMSVGTNPNCGQVDTSGVYAIQFGFDKLGNLESKTDKFNSETFTYDQLNRLKTETRNVLGGSDPKSYSYYANGNLRFRNGQEYLYNEPDRPNYPYVDNHPHAVRAYNGTVYNYDAVGNLTFSTGNVQRSIDYTGLNKAYRITYHNGTNNTDHEAYFQYDTSHSRYVRKDIKDGVLEKTTHYIGNVEMTRHGGIGSRESYKRFIGSLVIDLPSRQAYQNSWSYHYQLKDHLGSNHTIFTLERDGTIVDEQTLSFDSWGMRRWIDSDDILNADLVTSQLQLVLSKTNRGYTGHEHLDDIGIIHMNGRIYDPQLGRFLQADPYIQDPYNTQSLNRYTYVGNNPLSANDPTGYWTMDAFMDNGGRQVVSYVAAVVMQAMGVHPIISGAVTGAINGGSRGAVLGAFTAAIGLQNYGILTQSVIGGANSYINGGKFGHGFISAGALTMASPYIQGVGGQGFSGIAARTAISAIAGGTVSKLTGGKFENGALNGMLFQLAVESRKATLSGFSTNDRELVDELLKLHGEKTRLLEGRVELAQWGALDATINDADFDKVQQALSVLDNGEAFKLNEITFASGKELLSQISKFKPLLILLNDKGINGALPFERKMIIDINSRGYMKDFARGKKWGPVSLERLIAHEAIHAIYGVDTESEVVTFTDQIMTMINGTKRREYSNWDSSCWWSC